LANIDDEIIKALIQPDQYGEIGKEAPIRGLIGLKIIDYDTEVDVGKKRTVDILLIVRKESKQCKVAIEVENDRKFDVGEILRKIKRDKLYPTIVIIPKEFDGHAYRFRKSGIPVWYWKATCKWLCRGCNKITTSTSSLTPARCANCNKGGNFFLRWIEANVKFEKDEYSPSIPYEEYEIRRETAKKSLKIESLSLSPESYGEVKGYTGEVRVANAGKKILYNLTAKIEVERDGLYDQVLYVEVVEDNRVKPEKVTTRIDKKEPSYDVDSQWVDEKKRKTEDFWKQLRKDDFVFLMFPKQPESSFGFMDETISISRSNILKLMAGVEHRVTITVKAEDPEKNTVSATRVFRFEVEHEDDASVIFVP